MLVIVVESVEVLETPTMHEPGHAYVVLGIILDHPEPAPDNQQTTELPSILIVKGRFVGQAEMEMCMDQMQVARKEAETRRSTA
eukprot:1865501-Rhodomonas_salina.1